MTTELRVRNQSQQLYVRALSMAWRNNIQLHDPSLWLLRDAEIEEKMLRDADIAHAVGFRRHMIAGRQWNLIPKATANPRSDLAVAVGTELLRGIRHFTQARLQLARAFFSGARFARIHGQVRPLAIGDGRVRNWWVPVRLEDLDKRMYRIVPKNDGQTIVAHWERWDVAKSDWVTETTGDAIDTIRHVYQDDQATLGHGRALREALGWWWYAKENVFSETLIACERFAQGIITAKVDGARDADTGMPNEELIRAWQEVLEDLRSRHVLVHDAADTVEMVQMNSSGWELLHTVRDELRSTILTLILGANLTTSAAEGGSYALAEVQENSTEALVQFDRETLEETLTDDLLGSVWYHNHANLVELGLVDHRPRFSITQQKRQDPQQRAEVAERLSKMGVQLALDDVLEQTGFRKPAPGEVLIEPPAPEPPMGGMPGMPGLPPGGAQGGFRFRGDWEPPPLDDPRLLFDQKRHPKGSPEGGQFAPEDGASSGGGEKPKAKEKPKAEGKPKGKPKAKAEPAAKTKAPAFEPKVGDKVFFDDGMWAPSVGEVIAGPEAKYSNGMYMILTEDYRKVMRPIHTMGPADKSQVVSYGDVELNSDELMAVRGYTDQHYAQINAHLRGVDVSDNAWISLDKHQIIQRIAALDSAIERNVIGEQDLFLASQTGKIPEEVYRGAKLSDFGVDSLDDLNPGDELQNHGFVSTSKNIDIAKKFARGDNGFIMEVRTAPNSRGLDVEGISSTKGEAEVILARKSKFRVVEVIRESPADEPVQIPFTPIVKVEHIDPHGEKMRANFEVRHHPAGSPKGGQFMPADDAGGGGGKDKDAAPKEKPKAEPEAKEEPKAEAKEEPKKSAYHVAREKDHHEAIARIDEDVAKGRLAPKVAEDLKAAKVKRYEDAAKRQAPAPINPKGVSTEELHSEGGSYSPERQAMHREIIENTLAGVPPSESPILQVMGGGPAAGKSSIIKKGFLELPAAPVLANADEFKDELPEYRDGAAVKDPDSAWKAHEESSMLNKAVMAESAARRLDTVWDGTGDHSIKKLKSQLQPYRDAGYKIKSDYVSVDPEEAVRRAKARFEKTGRMVPESIIRETHRNVSAMWPDAVAQGLFDESNLYSTDAGTPVLLASSKGTKLTIHDEARYAEFVARGR